MDAQQNSYHLLLDMAHGSREAFNRFYELHSQYVFQIAMNIVKEKLTAEDVSHDVFLEVFQKPNQYNPKKASVKAWLAVKTKSRAIDYLRKKKPLLMDRFEAIIMSHEKDYPAEVVALSKIEKEIVFEALQHLPKDQRRVIHGAYFEEKTQREMAEDMDRPLGTVKSLVRYGLNNLRKQKMLLNWIDHTSGGEGNS